MQLKAMTPVTSRTQTQVTREERERAVGRFLCGKSDPQFGKEVKMHIFVKNVTKKINTSKQQL